MPEGGIHPMGCWGGGGGRDLKTLEAILPDRHGGKKAENISGCTDRKTKRWGGLKDRDSGSEPTDVGFPKTDWGGCKKRVKGGGRST